MGEEDTQHITAGLFYSEKQMQCWKEIHLFYFNNMYADFIWGNSSYYQNKNYIIKNKHFSTEDILWTFPFWNLKMSWNIHLKVFSRMCSLKQFFEISAIDHLHILLCTHSWNFLGLISISFYLWSITWLFQEQTVLIQ